MYEVLEHERAIEADRRRWNVRLRELLIAERVTAPKRDGSQTPKGPRGGPAHVAS
jgi:hypothetical protein